MHKHHSTPLHLGGHGPIQLVTETEHAEIHARRFLAGEDRMFHWSLYKFLDPELEQQVKDHLAEVKRKEWEEGTHAWHPLVRGERKQVDCHLGGVACAKKKVGAHAPGNQSRGGKRAVKKTNSQRWQCLVTGHISTPGPLTRYQVARGIDPKNRQLLKG